ncbi:hypothetical protein AWC27_02280 [Mycobacterium szulgai]|uniref:Alpha/beta hydrolase n=2 Tax=Mycobacterium szulgai TaxID=1787 RepID=A0A1X2EEY1_MYCSZ|nr:hypothetical protein AWC27_02280 [Mycobacterium szulgai]
MADAHEGGQMTAPSDDDGVFEPFADGVTASSSPPNEGSNVCRAAALAFLLRGAATAAGGLTTELRALGFSDLVLQDNARDWAGQNPLDRLGSYTARPDTNFDLIRMRGWAELNENADPAGAVGFLFAMLGSALERESAAAAAALWRGLRLATQLPPPSASARRRIFEPLYFDVDFDFDRRGGFWPLYPPGLWEPPLSAVDSDAPVRWDSDRWSETYQRFSYRLGPGDRDVDAYFIAALAFARLNQALRSPDTITRSLGAAALVREADADEPASEPDLQAPSDAVSTSPSVSTMIHGTWAYMGDWWRPRVGDFHRFIGDKYRRNLYSGGAHFHWSGNYRARHRARAAEFFAEWVTDRAPAGIQSLFAHSYGGEIAARALTLRTPIQELILLSTPVTSHVKAAAQSSARLIDIRLPFDPVLALELKTQRIPLNYDVTRVLTSWRLDHGATHKESVWLADDIAARAQLQRDQNLVGR